MMKEQLKHIEDYFKMAETYKNIIVREINIYIRQVKLISGWRK